MKFGSRFSDRAPQPPAGPQIGGVNLHFWEKRYQCDFPASWVTSNRPLFEFGLDYHNKTILDAGCNIGIIGYEISKLGAASYHGIDNYRAALEVALAIFSGVEIDYRFDRVDLCNDDQLSSALRPSYDIVLLLRTFHRLVTSYGEAQAKHTVEMLAARCTDKFVALVGDARLNRRSRPKEAASDQTLLVEAMTGFGFAVEHQRDVDVDSRMWTWFVFGRR